MMQRNIIGGIIYITVSLFILYSLIFYYNSVSAPFVALTHANLNTGLFKEISAFCSNILIQFFGLFSYTLSIIALARGISFFYWNRSKFKYQRLCLLVTLIFAPVLYNIASTYPMFKDILYSQKFDCYAGGYIGYAFSKSIFIDTLKQSQVYVWQISFIFVFLLWILQYICCFSYIDLFKIFRKILCKRRNIRKAIISTKKYSMKAVLRIKMLLLKLKKIFNAQHKTTDTTENLEQNYNELLEKYNANDADDTFTDDYDVHNVGGTESFSSHDQELEKSQQHTQETSGCKSINTNKYEDENTYFNNEFVKHKHHKYLLPSVDLLDKCDINKNYDNPELFKELSDELLKAMEEFSIKGEILKVKPGPIITVFEFKPAPGIKTSRVISLSEDIARSMSAISARISTIPGRNVLGIELPNRERQTVYLSELLSCDEFKSKNTGIQLVLGKDTNGNPIFADLTKMPHLLIAGTTGSGKSVSINDMILSILFKFKPNECKLIMIDPKMLELSVYDNIPHLLIPVVTDPKKAVSALKWAVSEMEQRYKNMAKLSVRNIEGFNKKLREAKENPELLIKKIQVGFEPETGKPIFETQKLDFEPMPYIVIFVDEMADLMLVAGKDVETAIQRLAQMARAAGIHLVMATQRPSVDVVTGTIKANFPTRISFQVSSKIDSRTILGEQGAEQLLGQGDMLYMSGVGRLVRVQAPFVQDVEIDRVVDFVKSQEPPKYVEMPEIEECNNSELSQLTIDKTKKRSHVQPL